LDFAKVGNAVYELPQSGAMKVPVRLYAREKMLSQLQRDRTLGQAANVAALPGIQKYSFVMPDGHEGYGFPIGGVAAFDEAEGGVVSPGGVGYDINCGVRLLKTNLHEQDVRPKLKELIAKMYDAVPSGVGSKSRIRLNPKELEEAVMLGAKWAVEHGMGVEKDLEHCEENGAIQGADYSHVSDMAKKRGGPQFGTLGAGNHFLEIQKVEKIHDAETAKAFGITEEGQITVMIHCGSRGYGHQICDDFLRTMINASEKYKIPLADRELCCAPLGSPEAESYLGAMRTAVNFAFCNRHVIGHWVRESFQDVLKQDWQAMGMETVYDVAHNIAKIEEHDVDGKRKKLCVHRKGATRAFWKNHPDVPAAYRAVGQPVIIPGSMNTSSYLLCGLEGAKETWGSTCHGAGRTMSRHEALRQFRGTEVQKQMEAQGMAVKAGGPDSLAEEAGGAYKDVSDVVGAVEDAGLCKIVAKLVPLGVIKG
jgi:tRNA-splicing ligase RtcB